MWRLTRDQARFRPTWFPFGLVAWLVLGAPGLVSAYGIALLPGASRESSVEGRPSLDLLTWDLPEGLLVADRIGPIGYSRLGTAFRPAYPRSEWFLVQPRAGLSRAAASTATLSEFGHVHFNGSTAALIEVPVENLRPFIARGFGVTNIPLTPPPQDRRARETVALATATAQVDTALKRAFIDSLSLPALDQLVQEISGHTPFWFQGQWCSVSTRSNESSGHDLVADYLKSKLQGWGYTVADDSFETYTGFGRNIVATKTGRTSPIVVVGGHYDSYAGCSPQCDAPGAEDNATGTSLVMELARISRNRQFDRTVQFVLFDTEEAGLVGSRYFVNDAVAAGRSVVGVVVTDMVGWYQNNFGLRIQGQPVWESLMNVMAANVTQYTNCRYVKGYSQGSDQRSFHQAGIPAIQAIEYDYPSYPYYHTVDDTWDKLQNTMPLALQIARATAATLVDLAGLPQGMTPVPPDTRESPRLSACPNPFNPRTTLRFDLAEAGQVRLGIYDVAGRLVRDLAGGQYLAGSHVAVWDGRDSAGRPMASASYFARLQAGAKVRTVRMGLVR